jgi:hypothetical protein
MTDERAPVVEGRWLLWVNENEAAECLVGTVLDPSPKWRMVPTVPSDKDAVLRGALELLGHEPADLDDVEKAMWRYERATAVLRAAGETP